ncbi:MAG: pyruvate kinase [Anaerolineales bacterium]|nr:pyruvate kinase [Anaerolineales bacterium]
MDRKVKIIATIGPASQEEAILEAFVRAGVNVARLNFSHGSHESHAVLAQRLRSVAARLNRPLAILQDLQGPKIRVGTLARPIELVSGQQVGLYPEATPAPTGTAIPVDFPQLFYSVRSGDPILMDDGRLALRVRQVQKNLVTAEVETGGTLTSHKGINLPGVRLNLPAFTDKDAEDLEFGLSLGVDLIAVSFVRQAEDVALVKQIVETRLGEQAPLVIAKLERPEAIDNLESILNVADGVMVARGDLGVEMPPEEVPGIQKRIIREANRKGKIVITATQMLESMVNNPLPTRAEASDVANAVYDGTDAVMLSGETAAGRYPVEAVVMMDRIVRHAEANFHDWGHENIIQAGRDDAIAICLAARELAHDRDVEAIAIFTRTGRTAILLSKARPCVPILAFTPVDETYRRLALAWGVTPHHVPWADTVEEMIGHVEQALKEKEMIQPGQQVVLVSGFPVRNFPQPNMALLHTVK